MQTAPMRLYLSLKYFVIHWEQKSQYLVMERSTHRIYTSGSFDISDMDGNPENIHFKDIYCLLGVIPIESVLFISVVTEAESRGKIQDKTIFEIKETELIEFNRSEEHRNLESHKLNIQKLLSAGFYFSYDYCLTTPINSFCLTRPLHDVSDTRFYWNFQLFSDFLAQNINSEWLIPIIQGFFASYSDHNTTLALISRRSCERAGTRYNCRGIDEKGNVANFVETEQVLIVEDKVFSYLQIRGSVPLFWEQTGITAQLSFTKSIEMSVNAFKMHANKLIEKYGHVSMINLLSSHKSHEKMLTKQWEEIFDKTFPEYSQNLAYNYFDFHANCKGQKYHKIGLLIDNIAKYLDFYGYYSSSEGLKQQGVIRTNCLDCLDRTNVVQGHIAQEVLMKQLRSLNLDYFYKQDQGFMKSFRHQWADNGDYLSVQYTGTGSTISSVTRDGPTGIRGLISQGITSIGRFYYANVADDTKQVSIDSILRKKNKNKIINKIQEELKNRSEEFIKFNEVKIKIVTWNLSGTSLCNLKEICKVDEKFEIIVFSLQHVKGFALEKFSDLMLGYQNLTCQIHSEYVLLIFAKEKIIDEITMFDYDTVQVPYMGRPTNKTAISVTFTLYDSTFCFISCHLVSGIDNNCARKDQIKYIHYSSFQDSKKLTQDFDAKFLLGDLNFRINLPSTKILDLISNENTAELLKYDQLSQNLKYGYISGYKESVIEFPPTYAYCLNTSEYDSSKKRGPSWCERILYSGNCEAYYYKDIKTVRSAHRPVEGRFVVKVKKIDLEKKRITEENIFQELAAGPLGSLPKMSNLKSILSCN